MDCNMLRYMHPIVGGAPIIMVCVIDLVTMTTLLYISSALNCMTDSFNIRISSLLHGGSGGILIESYVPPFPLYCCWKCVSVAPK